MIHKLITVESVLGALEDLLREEKGKVRQGLKYQFSYKGRCFPVDKVLHLADNVSKQRSHSAPKEATSMPNLVQNAVQYDQRQLRGKGTTIVGRVIMDLRASMSELKNTGNMWKGHKTLVTGMLRRESSAYLQRIRAISEKARASGVDILIFPACAFPFESIRDLHRFRGATRSIPWVFGGLLKISSDNGRTSYKETWEAWRRGKKAEGSHNESVTWLQAGKVSSMVAISSTIGIISTGEIDESAALPPKKKSSLIAIDMGHHQYSGRYVKTLRRVFTSMRNLAGRPDLVLLAFWKYRNSSTINPWAMPESGGKEKFFRYSISHGMGEGVDYLDVFRTPAKR
jgi:hypothetical protein